MNVSTESNEFLYRRCLEETKKRQNQDNRYCFELLRRAFDDQDHREVWMLAYQYLDQRIQVFCRSQGQVVDSKDYFALSNTIISNVWQRKRGVFESDFNTLGHFLKYVKITTKHSIWQLYLESARHTSEYIDDIGKDIQQATNLVEDRLMRDEFWQDVFNELATIARDDHEKTRYQVYIELRYRYGYKNQRIVQEYPELWADDNALRVDRQRIMRNLVKFFESYTDV